MKNKMWIWLLLLMLILPFGVNADEEDGEVENTNISNITVGNGSISPIFNSEKFEYIVNLNSAVFSIEVSTEDPGMKSKINITDSKGNNLNASRISFNDENFSNKMSIKVSIEGDDRVYTLHCQIANLKYDNSLSYLMIGSHEIALRDDKDVYEVVLEKGVESFKVSANLSDANHFMFKDDAFLRSTVPFDKNGTATVVLDVIPKSSMPGAFSRAYMIKVFREGSSSTSSSTKNNGSSGSVKPKPTSPTNSSSNSGNPNTGTTTEVVVATILVGAFIASMVLYKKNMEGYNK